jgi:hypothetical protein
LIPIGLANRALILEVYIPEPILDGVQVKPPSDDSTTCQKTKARQRQHLSSMCIKGFPNVPAQVASAYSNAVILWRYASETCVEQLHHGVDQGVSAPFSLLSAASDNQVDSRQQGGCGGGKRGYQLGCDGVHARHALSFRDARYSRGQLRR